MRYSILLVDVAVNGVDIIITAGAWTTAVGNGDDIKVNKGNLNNYSLPVVSEDGARMYYLKTDPNKHYLLLIPETHQYYNSCILMYNFDQDGDQDGYEGSQRVVEMMKKMFNKIRREIY